MRIAPCIPQDWTSFKIHYQYHDTTYAITVIQTAAGQPQELTVDGIAVQAGGITMVNDALLHSIEVHLAQGAPAGSVSALAA